MKSIRTLLASLPAPLLAQPTRAGGARRCLAGLCVAALLLGASAATARPVPAELSTTPFEQAPTASVVQRGPVSLEQASAMAARRLGGRVVKAETKTRDGRVEHEIRVLVDGRQVRTVRVDAQTGEFR